MYGIRAIAALVRSLGWWLSQEPGIGVYGCACNASSLSTSLCTSPSLMLLLGLPFFVSSACFGLAPATVVHDHLRGHNVGAVRLGDGSRPRGACAAVGSTAAVAACQILHGRVLLGKVWGEGIRQADCLFEHEADGRRSPLGDAQGRVRCELAGVPGMQGPKGSGALGGKAYGALGLWLLGRRCCRRSKVPLAGVLETRGAAETVCRAAFGTRRARVVVLGPEEVGSLLLALL